MTKYAKIKGTGSFLPAQQIGNAELANLLAKRGIETSDDWIFTRSGIQSRHFAAENEMTSDLAAKAALAALDMAKLTPQDIDLIILATSTPDNLGGFPSTACVVQDKLGIKNNALDWFQSYLNALPCRD